MTRDGRCSACGLPVALHFTAGNRKLTCTEAAKATGKKVGMQSPLARQLRSMLNRKDITLNHEQCGTPMSRKRHGVYECPSCAVTVIVGRPGDRGQVPEGDRRQLGHISTLSERDGDWQ